MRNYANNYLSGSKSCASLLGSYVFYSIRNFRDKYGKIFPNAICTSPGKSDNNSFFIDLCARNITIAAEKKSYFFSVHSLLPYKR